MSKLNGHLDRARAALDVTHTMTDAEAIAAHTYAIAHALVAIAERMSEPTEPTPLEAEAEPERPTARLVRRQSEDPIYAVAQCPGGDCADIHDPEEDCLGFIRVDIETGVSWGCTVGGSIITPPLRGRADSAMRDLGYEVIP